MSGIGRLNPLNLDDVRKMLPKVGDKRREMPTIDEANSWAGTYTKKPARCTVIYVNTEHLWYRVRFENGLTECYKMPKGTLTGGVRS
jgi:hypothetical protein